MRHLIAAASLLLFSCATGNATLSEEQLIEKARGIHDRVLTLDTHKDIHPALATDPTGDDKEAREEHRKRFDPTVRGTNQVDFPKSREGGYDCGFYIVFVGQGPVTGAGFVQAKRAAFLKFDAIHRMARKYPEQIAIAYTPDDVRRIHASGRLVACIGIENGYPMGTNLGLIEEFHKRGARYMGITHNRHNQLGDSHTPKTPMHGGLTELGRKAIAEMNRVGIMVDISHTAKTTMLQALKTSQAPVIASHSGCYAICANSRNLDDEQLLALKDNGGVVQIVALAAFVKDYSKREAAADKLREEIGLPGRRDLRRMRIATGVPKALQEKLSVFRARMKPIDAAFPPATVRDFVDHIEHATRLIGIDHVAISSDFDGGGGIVGWRDASETFNITLELVRRGYSEKEIAKLWSGNTLKLWEEVAFVARKTQADLK